MSHGSRSIFVDNPVSPLNYEDVKIEDEGEGEMPEFEVDDSDEEEEKKVKMMRDPGAPTQAHIDAHNMTHLPFRAGGSAKDRPHRKDKGEEKAIATMVFDYGFLGTEGVKESLPMQIMKHVQSGMICAHAVPRKGLMDEYGADELVLDIGHLGYNEIILKCDGEPALTNIQKEVAKRRVE